MREREREREKERDREKKRERADFVPPVIKANGNRSVEYHAMD